MIRFLGLRQRGLKQADEASMAATRLLLIVEDEFLILDFAMAALEDGGYTLISADDGHDAISVIDKQIGEISAIITDIRLPSGPDGWEIAHYARELNPAIPIIYVSGDGAEHWAANGVPKSLFLQKPYAAAQLLTAISTLLNEADSQLS